MTKKEPSQADIEIGTRIRELRTAILQMNSQTAFAKPLGVTRGAVGNWELGQGIKRENLQKIATVYQISMNWLATGIGTPKDTTSDSHESADSKLAELFQNSPEEAEVISNAVHRMLDGALKDVRGIK